MKRKKEKKKLVSILLTEDISFRDRKDNIIEVKPGYALNFLIPKKKAVYADETIIAQVKEKRKKEELYLKDIKDKAINLKKDIEKIEIFEVKKRMKHGLVAFSKVTRTQIIQSISNKINKNSDELSELKILDLPEIRKKGDQALKIKLHKEVEAEIMLRIIPE